MIKTILKNSASNGALLLINLSITFVMSPIIVRALGNHDYGIWEIVFSVVGYMGLLDLGIKPAIIHFVAKYNATDDKKKLKKLYSSSLFFIGLGGFGGFLFLTFWAILKPELLAYKGSDPVRYFIFLLIIGIQVLVSFPGYIPVCFHYGFQRHHLANKVKVAITLIVSSVLFVLLQRGYGLLTLALVSTVGVLVRVGIHLVLLSFPEFGNFRFRIGDISRKSIKEFLTFGLKDLIRSIATTIVVATDSIVIGTFLGPTIVTFYAIPVKLVQYTLNLAKSITQPFMPFFSHMNAQKDETGIEKVLLLSSKYVAGFSMPIFGALFFLGLPFLARWMGPDFAENGRWVLYFFIGAYGLILLNPLSNDFLVGIGRHGMLAKIRLTIALSNLVLSLIFVQFLGKEGVALGTLIPMVVFEPVILYFTCKHLSITMWEYIRQVLLPLVIPNAFFLLLLWILTSSFTLVSYFSILAIGISSILMYSLLFYIFSLGRDEKEFILGKIKARFA